MKKKILMLLLTVVIACVGVVGITACDSYTYSDSGLIYRLIEKRYYVVGASSDLKDTDIVIPARFENTEVVGIVSNAFKDNSKITSVTLESGLRSISSSAFENCSALVSVTIPSSVTLLGTYLFKNCTSLTSVSLPNNLSVVSGGMFYGCTALETISLPMTTTRISDNAFGKSGLTSIVLPASVTEIGESTFSNCTLLESISLSQNLLSIDKSAFYKCESLEEIVLPDSLRFIYEHAFFESGLIDVTFEDTSFWRVRPHNYIPDETSVDRVILLDETELGDNALAAQYLVKDYNKGYSNYAWFKSDK